MAEPTGHIDELRKRFPALDDFSREKLLGGDWGGPDYWDPDWASGGTHDFVSGWQPPGSFSSEFSQWFASQSGKPAATDGGGDAYFGDGDGGDDSGSGMDWGDDGGGPNVIGYADSSPGGFDEVDDPSPPPGSNLEWYNNDDPQQYPHRTFNMTNYVMYCKSEGGSARITIQPGSFTDEPIDAFKINGFVYKVCGDTPGDSYGLLIVTSENYFTNFNDNVNLAQQTGWNIYPGNPCQRSNFGSTDHQWDDIFLPP